MRTKLLQSKLISQEEVMKDDLEGICPPDAPVSVVREASTNEAQLVYNQAAYSLPLLLFNQRVSLLLPPGVGDCETARGGQEGRPA